MQALWSNLARLLIISSCNTIAVADTKSLVVCAGEFWRETS